VQSQSQLHIDTVESVQSARIVVYGFVAGDVGADDSVSRLDVRVDDSAVQYFERRPEHRASCSFSVAEALVLQTDNGAVEL